MQKESQEFTPQDYLNKIKESCQIKVTVDTKFIQKEEGKDVSITVDDLAKKKKPLFIGRVVEIQNIRWSKMSP